VTETTQHPNWVIDILAEFVHDSDHYPEMNQYEEDCKEHNIIVCQGCSEARDEYEPWPCPMVKALPIDVQRRIEEMHYLDKKTPDSTSLHVIGDDRNYRGSDSTNNT
jgi:hypothetical protein